MISLSQATKYSGINLSQLLPDIQLPEEISSIKINSLVADSRKVEEGELFLALGGELHDGRDYIPSAILNGAVAVIAEASSPIIESEKFAWEKIDGVPVLYLQNIKTEIGKIAARFYRHPSRRLNVIGITGTNGKSTCVSLLAQAFTILGEKAASMGTLGYGFADQTMLTETGMTTPDAIKCQEILCTLADQNADVVAIEVSSHGIDQDRIAGIEFDTVVLTNITHDHLDYHLSFENYAAVKKEFIVSESDAIAVLNIDDPEAAKIAEQLRKSNRKLFTYSIANSKADVYVKRVEFNPRGIVATLSTLWGEMEIKSHLVGMFNLSNLCATIAVLASNGADITAITNAVDKLKPVKGRMEFVELEGIHSNAAPKNNIAVYIDYAHTPDALEKALSALRQHASRQLWVVFGCGGNRDQGKRKVMGQIACQHADKLVVTSDNPRYENPERIVGDILSGIDSIDRTLTLLDRKEAIEYAINRAEEGDCILVAGKGHENYQQIEDEKLPFDDYSVAQHALAKRMNNTRRVQL